MMDPNDHLPDAGMQLLKNHAILPMPFFLELMKVWHDHKNRMEERDTPFTPPPLHMPDPMQSQEIRAALRRRRSK